MFGTDVIIKDGNGKSRGFGFVYFELPDEAKKAVEALTGAILGSKKSFLGRAQKKAERVAWGAWWSWPDYLAHYCGGLGLRLG
ncbi:Polyadenylate-binding protein 6 [Vitis vinifera]|uniref:Polyadenylate-binding protein 6 n=1 Tax=Vitis vinifera TaxID=29760 RepID=A0A438I636_VITVI|nr:Polyadenylate-binding protein 6 [Vitis vinifera]